jgi:hypothetical protein
MPKQNTPKTRMARLVKAKDMDRSFDLLFWKQVGAEARFAAAWQMVSEVNAIKGKNIGESRLQRSVQSIERIQR